MSGLRSMLPHTVEVFDRVDLTGARDRYGLPTLEAGLVGVVAADTFESVVTVPDIVAAGRVTPVGGFPYVDVALLGGGGSDAGGIADNSLAGNILTGGSAGVIDLGATVGGSTYTVGGRLLRRRSGGLIAAGALDPFASGVGLTNGGTFVSPDPSRWSLFHVTVAGGPSNVELDTITRDVNIDNRLRLTVEPIAGPGVRVTGWADGVQMGPFDVTGAEGAELAGQYRAGIYPGATFDDLPLFGGLSPLADDLVVFGALPAPLRARVELNSGDEEDTNRDQSTDRFVIFLEPEARAAIRHTAVVRWVDEDLILEADANARPVYGRKGVDHYELDAKRIEG